MEFPFARNESEFRIFKLRALVFFFISRPSSLNDRSQSERTQNRRWDSGGAAVVQLWFWRETGTSRGELPPSVSIREGRKEATPTLPSPRLNAEIPAFHEHIFSWNRKRPPPLPRQPHPRCPRLKWAVFRLRTELDYATKTLTSLQTPW